MRSSEEGDVLIRDNEMTIPSMAVLKFRHTVLERKA